MTISGSVGRFGFAVSREEFKQRLGGEPQLRKLLNSLTVREKVHPGRPTGMSGATRHAYYTLGDLLVMPRRMAAKMLCLLDGGIVPSEANRALPPARKLAAVAAAAALYPYQEVAVKHILEVVEAGAPAYLQMDTGLGKTRVGCAIAVMRGEPTLIVVPTDPIAEQWIDEFAESYPGIKVAIYRNTTASSKHIPASPYTHDVVIVIINTFRNKTPDFMEGFGTTILDEVHELHSACNSRALWLAQTDAVIGLSATPDERPDGMDKYIFHHLGMPIYARDIPGFDINSVNFKCNVRVVEYHGHSDYCDTAVTPTGTMSAILTINNILFDPYRMMMVATEVERLCAMEEISAVNPNARHGVFVFAETREYLPRLKEMLLARVPCAEIIAPEIDQATGAADDGGGVDNDTAGAADDTADNAGGADNDTAGADNGVAAVSTAANSAVSVLRGGVAKTAVGDAKRAGAHIVLTTYGFSRRGISLPDMTCIIAATPRRNGLRQIIGRILRRGSDESIMREIVDIVDVKTGLRGQFADRRKVYKERNYPIRKITKTWSEFDATAADDITDTVASELATPDDDLSREDILDLLHGL
jgi:superfamily II DNA or RNA helicase